MEKTQSITAPVSSISRHRILVDGEGVTTLVCFHGCPLRCKYCLNRNCILPGSAKNARMLTPRELYDELRVDDIYFRATDGGVCFGGGEPGLQAEFIREFRDLCGKDWRITVETSLNIPWENAKMLADVADFFLVDIKDMNSDIYKAYTGRSNKRVLENLNLLPRDRTCVRVPRIKGFNTDKNVEVSTAMLNLEGFTDIDVFTYRTTPVEQQPLVDEDEWPEGEINYGKAVCEVLKNIRRTVAAENGIELQQPECPHRVCGSGACPVCDNEAIMLRDKIYGYEKED